MKNWTLLLTPRADDVTDTWVLSSLSPAADHVETLELGVWRIREGNGCVSLELSLLMMELVSPVTLRALCWPLVLAVACSVSCAYYLSPCTAEGSNIPVLIPFTYLGCLSFLVAPCGFLCSFHWW